MDIELVAEGLEFPEGPMAMADGSVILVEMERRTLTRVAADGATSIVADCGGGPNGAAIGPDGKIWVANNGGSFEFLQRNGLNFTGTTPASHVGGSIQRVDIASGEVETVYEACDGKRLVGPNDLVFDRSGGLWFTDHGCGTPEGRKFGALYYATPDGVGLSPDESVVYMADTQLGRLWAFDLAAPGELASPTPFPPGRVIHNLQGFQLLDSLAVEAGGKVCVATLINGGVTAFDPDGAIEHFAFPDLLTTNICFGGADMRDAWVTCTSTGKLYKCRWPRPGLKLNFNA